MQQLITIGNQIELRHFKYFLAVAEELHFRKASEKLFITQPGLSRQIRQLEEAIGAPLFERNKRNVELTDAGHYLKDQLQLLFNQFDTVFRTIQFINSGEDGEIRIGFVGSAMQNVIPDLLLNMNEQFPGLRTNLEEMNNADQLQALEQNKLDVGFVRLDTIPSGMEYKIVFEDNFSVVLPKDHPISEGNFTGVGQLSHENFILFSREYSPGYYETIISICREQGFTPKVSHKSIHANTIFRLVENHLGVSIVPSSFQHGFDLNIKFLELKNIPQRTQLSAIWRKGNNTPTLRKFLSLLK